MDLICRTCLKLNLVRVNIFEYSQNARLVSDIIMEVTSIKVSENDELPVSICNKCLEKLNSAYDFKQMVIESDKELFQLRQSKIIEDEKQLQPINSREIHLQEEFQLAHSKIIEVDKELQSADSIEICLKEETEVIKSEQIEFVPCLSSIDEITTEDVVVLSDGEDISIKQEDIGKELDHLNDYDGQISISMRDKHESCVDSNVENKCVTDADESVDCENQVPIENRKMRTRSGVYRKKRTIRNFDHLLKDNPDCKRIMESILSAEEKNASKVYCQLCHRTLSFRQYKESHIHIHTGNLPYKCDECGLRVVNKYRLKQHMVSHIKTKEYTCEECGKVFAAIRQLRAHKIVHSSKRPYVCNICKKSFKLLATLRYHQVCHNSRKQFICEKCGKSYFHKRDLYCHQKTHSKDKKVSCKTYRKPLKCSGCGKEFALKKYLTQHMLTHKNLKPYSCKICGKAYRQEFSLGRHIRLHTGELPHSCKLCTASFIYSHLLKGHMRKHIKAVSGGKDVKNIGT